MMPFDFAEPRTLAEALALLDPEDPTVRPIAGGTALMLMMKSAVFQPTRLVSLARLEPYLTEIAATGAGGLRIGALATLSALEGSATVRRFCPVIAGAMARLANVRVRNVARVGGALAHGDPHMDLPPVAAALRGEAVITSQGGERSVPVADLFRGYFETVLARDELITALVLPPPAGWSTVYLKCTTRAADDWPALGIAASVRQEGGTIVEARLMLGAAAETLTRLAGAEAVLRDREPDAALLARATEAAAAEVGTVADARGTAAYKTHLLRVYLARALRQALAMPPKAEGEPA